MATRTEKKKKIKKKLSKAVVHIKNTFNNTIVSVSDMSGNVIVSGSAGSYKFKGDRKSTRYAAQVVASAVFSDALKYGVKEVDIYVKGPGYGRESAIRAIAGSGVQILSIRDVTGIPHNGCRPRKIRRI